MGRFVGDFRPYISFPQKLATVAVNRHHHKSVAMGWVHVVVSPVIMFVVVILGSTGAGAPSAMAGLAIGLTLVAIHLVGINVTGVSVNPARSIGPALFAGGTAIGQLWLFILAPIIGGLAAGALFKPGLLDSE